MRIMQGKGKNRFQDYIQELRQNPLISRPDLNMEEFSVEFLPQVFIDETKKFKTKLELAEYLEDCFKKSDLKREDVLKIDDLWTWLAYIWFDQLAPLRGGLRYIKEDAKYICSSEYRDYYRHLIAGPYGIYSLHGKDNSHIFLYSPVYEHNDFIEQFASRQFIISYKNIVEAINKLYFDTRTNNPKRGVQSRTQAGNIRRFVSIIQQLELTYDIYSMTSEQIIDLLPPEFNYWKQIS